MFLLDVRPCFTGCAPMFLGPASLKRWLKNLVFLQVRGAGNL